MRLACVCVACFPHVAWLTNSGDTFLCQYLFSSRALHGLIHVFLRKKQMQKSFTYKQESYRLQVQETPERLRKWDEVMHYLNHLPEFVNEVFEDHQIENIKEDFWNYVKHKFDGPKPLLIRKKY